MFGGTPFESLFGKDGASKSGDGSISSGDWWEDFFSEGEEGSGTYFDKLYGEGSKEGDSYWSNLYSKGENSGESWWGDFFDSSSGETTSWWESFFDSGSDMLESLFGGGSGGGSGSGIFDTIKSVGSGLWDTMSGWFGGDSGGSSSVTSGVSSAINSDMFDIDKLGLGGFGGSFAKGGAMKSAGLGAYSSSIVKQPTVFPFAKGVGLMGEAGWEAIMPLARMPNGELGVKAQQRKSDVDNRIHSASISVPISISNASKRLSAELQRGIESTVRDILRRQA
jgi:hypothetical protein